MKKNSKIIVSIIGITIVLLALLGLTYAYYLTRIEGNTNTNSISVTTAKLELVYGDNSAEILTGSGALMPSTDLTSAGAIGTKTFTVTNNGNDSSYVVVIDNVSITKVSDGSSTSFVSNDFRYTLSCSVKDKSGNLLENETCNKVSNLDIFPINGGILVNNDIPEDRVHEYTLTLWYIDTGLNQSDDMGKSYQARVNIKDMTAVNPFSTGVSATDNASLVYNIINNAKTNKNGTTFVNNPLTTPAKGSGNIVYTSYTDPTSFSNTSSYTSKWYVYGTAITMDKDGYFKITNPQVGQFSSVATSMINGYITTSSGYADEESARAVMYNEFSSVYKVGASTTTSKLYYKAVTKNSENIESVLSVTTDDYGTSYYYRGGVTDNYVNFAGMCWRIVRIEGDGSVKLILEDRNEQCNDKEGQDLNNNGTYFTGNWSGGEEDYYVFGYDDNYRADFLNYEGGLADSFKTFQTALAKKINTSLTDTSTQTEINTALSSKLKIDEWCYDDNITEYKHYDSDYNLVPNPVDGGYTDEYYGAYTRIYTNKKPSFSCSGTKLTKFKDNTNMYVATLTADEMSFAGASGSTNYNYYLMNSYAKDNYLYWWSLSPYIFFGEFGDGYAFSLSDNGGLYDNYVVNDYYSRPAVSLKSGSVITGGEGTLEKPYIIG